MNPSHISLPLQPNLAVPVTCFPRQGNYIVTFPHDNKSLVLTSLAFTSDERYEMGPND
jgi:hypothetical protein